MENNNFILSTSIACRIVGAAYKEADRLGHEYVGTEHLLLNLIRIGHGNGHDLLQRIGVDLDELAYSIERGETDLSHSAEAITTLPLDEDGIRRNLPRTSSVRKVIEIADREAGKMSMYESCSGFLLLAMIKAENSNASKLLKSYGVTAQQCLAELLTEPSFYHDPIESPDLVDREAVAIKHETTLGKLNEIVLGVGLEALQRETTISLPLNFTVSSSDDKIYDFTKQEYSLTDIAKRYFLPPKLLLNVILKGGFEALSRESTVVNRFKFELARQLAFTHY